MHECGLPKNMAAELYKPFIIRKLIERGMVNRKERQKIVDRKDPEVWEYPRICDEGSSGVAQPSPDTSPSWYPGIPARLIEGKAIQLHPLCLYGVQCRLRR